MNACLKRSKTWFFAGGVVLAVAGVTAGVWCFYSDKTATSSSLRFSLKSVPSQATATAGADEKKQPAETTAAIPKKKEAAPKALTAAGKAEGLRLLEQARAFELGRNGSPVDLKKAFALYQKAAALGSTEAWYRMGLLARDGKVDGVDARSAMKFFKEAADAGYTDAYTALARAYMGIAKQVLT
jgi:TPR repeat protein